VRNAGGREKGLSRLESRRPLWQKLFVFSKIGITDPE
jgi:hypothetical protein